MHNEMQLSATIYIYEFNRQSFFAWSELLSFFFLNL